MTLSAPAPSSQPRSRNPEVIQGLAAGGEGGIGDLDRHGPGGLRGQVAAAHITDVVR